MLHLLPKFAQKTGFFHDIWYTIEKDFIRDGILETGVLTITSNLNLDKYLMTGQSSYPGQNSYSPQNSYGSRFRNPGFQNNSCFKCN